MKEKLSEAIALFQSLDAPQQAAFSFWSLCVVGFYSTVLYIIYLLAKEGISRLRGTRI
jgi:hypothetical protein